MIYNEISELIMQCYRKLPTNCDDNIRESIQDDLESIERSYYKKPKVWKEKVTQYLYEMK